MLLSATIEIASVQSSADMLRFIEFPYEHYREDPNWVGATAVGSAGDTRYYKTPVL